MRNYAALPSGTVSRARALRRGATDAEKRLWRLLREKLPSAKWRRQVPYGPYFADFASVSQRLIVEVDGGQHAADAAYDATRTRFLEAQGYRVLRFRNNEVLGNGDGVLSVIAAALPSPLVGEGGLQGRMGGARPSRARTSGPHPHPSPPHRGEGGSDKPPVWSQ